MNKIDIDALFEEYVKNYLKENRGKITEDGWEDMIPALYEGFAKAPLDKLGGKTPSEYFGGISAEDLVKILKESVDENFPVSDILFKEIVKNNDTEKHLIAAINKGEKEEFLTYVVNALAEKFSIKALPVLVGVCADKDYPEGVRETSLEVLLAFPEDAKEDILKAFFVSDDKTQIDFCDVLSRVKVDKNVSKVLFDKAKSADKNLSLFASFLSRYGDEDALPILYEIIERKLDFADFREVKFAIESLGGSYEKERDFSLDKTYKLVKGIKD